jgi:chlorobactene glucosyltransferase
LICQQGLRAGIMTRWYVRAVHLTSLLILAGFTYRLWRNLRFLRRARVLARPPDGSSLVSVLVPARNEAENIAVCVESLVRQDYPNFEIIVLDDQSTDETGAILDDLAARYTVVSVVHGAENPPAGWNGKSYACQQLAQQAAGEWLLFTDADTYHMPLSIAQGVAQAEGLRIDLLSAFPRQITESWAERVVVSFILDFLPLVALDLTTLWRGASANVAANGQYLLVHAAAYRAAGGHQAIYQALVDDFALAKHLHVSGFRIALVDGKGMVKCRMYHSAGEVWAGFSKNILLALEDTSVGRRSRLWGLLFAWGYASVFVLPFLLLFGRHKTLPLLVIGWLGMLRIVVNQHLERPITEAMTTPLAALGVMAFGLGALLRRWCGGNVQWKGRDYTLSR